MSSLFKTFQTDESMEKEGIFLRYGECRFRISRAGGANVAYKRRLSALTKQYRHQIDNETLDEAIEADLVRQVYAETVVLGWETLEVENGQEVWKPYVADRDGTKLEYTPKNAIHIFKQLPELFADIQRQASRVANFRAATEEDDAKNSVQS